MAGGALCNTNVKYQLPSSEGDVLSRRSREYSYCNFNNQASRRVSLFRKWAVTIDSELRLGRKGRNLWGFESKLRRLGMFSNSKVSIL